MDSGGSLPNSNCEGLLESSGDFWRITSNSEVIRARSRHGGSVNSTDCGPSSKVLEARIFRLAKPLTLGILDHPVIRDVRSSARA